MNQEEIKALLRKYNVRPSKSKGQNFLMDEDYVSKAIEAGDLDLTDNVVEIGPGFGILTKALAEKVNKVVAVELDQEMYKAGKEILAEYKNVELINEDILKIKNQDLFKNESYKVVANLPYSITSFALRKFTEYEPRPELIIVMIQKEVAERICAKKGYMTVLAAAIQYYGIPEIVTLVPSGVFYPEPKVDSAILKIVLRKGVDKFNLSKEEEKKLFQLIKIGFSSRRKQLHKNISSGLRISKEQAENTLKNAGFDPKMRAQELDIKDWIKILKIME